MKLKSKLIATIVSMCAAIAVMGVGVWASTSQNFTVTVKNDVDVKIINVNADVYGEFALYTQFSGSDGTADTTPTFAKRVTATEASVATGYKSRENYDHGYLLYAIGIGGYNDGVTGAFKGATDYKANDDATWGYGRYINESKNNVFLATKNGTLPNSNTTATDPSIRDTGATPFVNSYNVDSTTHISQVAYMYTINQWAADGTDNSIYGKINAALTEATITKITATNKGDKYNSLIIPNLYIGQLAAAAGEGATKTTAWKSLPLDGTSGNAYFEIPSTKDAADDNGGTYYVLLTFTFARNNANLDLSLLEDALQHTLTLVTSDEKEAGATYVTATGGTERVFAATNGTLSNDNKYTVDGAAYNPNTKDIEKQVTGAYNQERLKNTFALDAETKNKSFLPAGFIYVAAEANGDLAAGFAWIKELYQGGRSAQAPYGVKVA